MQWRISTFIVRWGRNGLVSTPMVPQCNYREILSHWVPGFHLQELAGILSSRGYFESSRRWMMGVCQDIIQSNVVVLSHIRGAQAFYGGCMYQKEHSHVL